MVLHWLASPNPGLLFTDIIDETLKSKLTEGGATLHVLDRGLGRMKIWKKEGVAAAAGEARRLAAETAVETTAAAAEGAAAYAAAANAAAAVAAKAASAKSLAQGQDAAAANATAANAAAQGQDAAKAAAEAAARAAAATRLARGKLAAAAVLRKRSSSQARKGGGSPAQAQQKRSRPTATARGLENGGSGGRAAGVERPAAVGSSTSMTNQCACLPNQCACLRVVDDLTPSYDASLRHLIVVARNPERKLAIALVEQEEADSSRTPSLHIFGNEPKPAAFGDAVKISAACGSIVMHVIGSDHSPCNLLNNLARATNMLTLTEHGMYVASSLDVATNNFVTVLHALVCVFSSLLRELQCRWDTVARGQCRGCLIAIPRGSRHNRGDRTPQPAYRRS